MEIKPTKKELDARIKMLCIANSEKFPDWETAIIISHVNQYYFTSTMQNGLLVIKNDGTAKYFVRKSYERAIEESAFDAIYPIGSYKDIVPLIGSVFGNTLIETNVVTIDILERLKKYFEIKQIYPVDNIIFGVRSVKSSYELYWSIEAGKRHSHLLDNVVPNILREGMSELEFTAELYKQMLSMGFHGVSRFFSFQTEMIVGQISFGENSLYPTNFDGPGGMKGMYPAVPILGSRERLLKKGDLVFVDIGFGMYGYHSDKTQVYMFGSTPNADVVKQHRKCIEIQNRIAELLKPGELPSVIYNNIIGSLDNDFLQNFMGFGKNRVKFLGHGIGLHVDEPPAIAYGFDNALQENMVMALEPKKGIAGIGMVGVEDTYIVTPDGAQCITGGGKDIIVV